MAERINGAVGGLLEDEEGLEKLMERVRRICQAEVQKRIGHQKVTELVVNVWDRHWVIVEEQEAKEYDQKGETYHAETGFVGELVGIRLQKRMPGKEATDEQEGKCQNKIVADAEAEWIFER